MSVNSLSLRIVKGDHTGPNPTDCGKAGSKLHLAVDRAGIPVAVLLTVANPTDSTMFEALWTISTIYAVRTPTGR
jgi:hypothetical protein